MLILDVYYLINLQQPSHNHRHPHCKIPQSEKYLTEKPGDIFDFRTRNCLIYHHRARRASMMSMSHISCHSTQTCRCRCTVLLTFLAPDHIIVHWEDIITPTLTPPTQPCFLLALLNHSRSWGVIR